VSGSKRRRHRQGDGRVNLPFLQRRSLKKEPIKGYWKIWGQVRYRGAWDEFAHLREPLPKKRKRSKGYKTVRQKLKKGNKCSQAGAGKKVKIGPTRELKSGHRNWAIEKEKKRKYSDKRGEVHYTNSLAGSCGAGVAEKTVKKI